MNDDECYIWKYCQMHEVYQGYIPMTERIMVSSAYVTVKDFRTGVQNNRIPIWEGKVNKYGH